MPSYAPPPLSTKCLEIHLPKRKLNISGIFLTKSNNFLNEKEMFKVLFWFQINNMSHSLETKIPVVILTAKYESPVMGIRQLQRRGTINIPVRQIITQYTENFSKPP